jgi:hypothetical protein
MEFFSLYIITMSKNDEDYLDDPEIIDFNEELDARAAQQMEEGEGAISPLMFGKLGRGSPAMDIRTNRALYLDAATALRNAGINNEKHMKDLTNLVLNEQQKAEAEDAKRFDVMIANMYKEMKNPVKSGIRPISKAKLPSSKKGGTRKRSTRRSRRKSKRTKRSRK